MAHSPRRPARPVKLALMAVAAAVAMVAAGLVVFPSAVKAAPRVVLFDDFDRIDRSKWLVANHASDVNGELQYYTPASVSARGGVLRLGADRRAAGGREYVSGLASTAGKFAFTYGTVEWRAWVAGGQGLWPALWLLGEDCAATFQSGSQRCPTWPAPGSSEVDVLEYRGGLPNQVHMAHHHNTEPGRTAGMSCQWNGPNYSAGWHTYELEWAPGRLIWRVDGVERCRTAKDVPNEPMFLIMNLAVGGFWSGSPNANTPFPQEFRVDWVRVTKP